MNMFDQRLMTGPRPRLLFLSHTLPYPPDGGVNIRTYNILRLLSKSFEITALCFYRTAARRTPRDVRASVEMLGRFAEVEAFPIPQESSHTRFLWDHVRSAARNRAYTVFTYESRQYRQRLAELVRERDFDLVHVDSLDLAAYLPLVGHLPVVCVHHNVESSLLRRRAATERAGPRRAYLAHQGNLLAREEKHWCERVSMNVVVSENDRRHISSIAPRGSVVVVPNGVDTGSFRPVESHESGIVFVGGLSWYPNRDALEYFCSEIWPQIRSKSPSVAVHWVGRASEQVRTEYARRHGVDMTGYVNDIRPHVCSAACYVVPIRVGGGTRLKILDAWAMGKAVVSTSIGCEGLAAQDGVNILIRDNPHEFAEAVCRVLEDSALRHRLGSNARSTAEETYSWEVIGESMLREYFGVLERTTCESSARH